MAINRVDYPASTPASLTDWTDNIALHEASFLRTEESRRIDYSGDVVMRGAVFQIGGSVYLADSDTAITGTSSDYVKITPSGSIASASYVADLTGVSWNSVYNGWYDGSGNLYVFDEGKAFAAGEITEVHSRYLMQQANGDVAVGGNVTVVDGNVTVDGNDVVTTSSGTQTIAGTKTFSGDVDFTGQVRPRTDPTNGSQHVGSGSDHTPIRGLYNGSWGYTNRGALIPVGGASIPVTGGDGPYSGSNFISNKYGSGIEWYYVRF